MRKIVLLVVASALFFGAVIGVVAGFSTATEREKRVTHLTYDLEGNFSHQAFEKSAPEKKPNPRYFMKIIDSIDVHYSYQFLAGEPVTGVTEEVEISAIVSSPGVWEKEIILVPRAEQVGAFTISFPLETSVFSDLAANITEQLGMGKLSPEILLKASVYTTANTKTGRLSDNFTQTCRVKLTPTILEWDSQPVLSEMRYAQGLRYVHHGNFGYAIQLKDNILFGAVIMEPETPPPPGPPVPLKSSDTYQTETIDSINGTFSYQFQSEEPLLEVINEVEVTATLGKVEAWQETFVLVPRSQKTGDFSVSFPLDVPLFYAMMQSHEKETGTPAASELIITTDVHTIAQSEFGPIEETLSQSLTVPLGPDEVAWPETDPVTKEGAIVETIIVPNPAANTARIGSLGALGMMAVLLLYAIWSFWEFKHKWVSKIEADALQVRNKHKDLVADVEKLPDIENEETVIELGSLSELIKVADSLFKPVLRLAEPERHIYCVIDGTTRYQYVSLAQYVRLSEYQ